MKRAIIAEKAPQAIGPYSQAIRAGDYLFISGQLGLDPKSGNLAVGVMEQAEQALINLSSIVEAAGGSLSDVVKTLIFLTDIKDFSLVNEVYTRFFKEEPPARSTVQVMALPRAGLVEIEAVAWLGKQR